VFELDGRSGAKEWADSKLQRVGGVKITGGASTIMPEKKTHGKRATNKLSSLRSWRVNV
jgi:hypothetical protein